jgi:putative zinc finger/helix-turn-helix YgiT family protein
MICNKCGAKGVEFKESTIQMEMRGVSVEFAAEVEICGKCGHYSIPGRVANEFGRRLDAAYRQATGLLTASQIIAARKRLRFNNQKDFADYLGVGEASVKRWEAGAVLDKSSNELILTKTSLDYAQRNVERICALEGRETPVQTVVGFMRRSQPPSAQPHANWRSSWPNGDLRQDIRQMNYGS